VSHANATLTPITRLRLARQVVDRGWSCAAVAKMFMVSPRTAKKWADRYRVEGVPGMVDRSSRPHRGPTRTSDAMVRQIVGLRWRHRLGPVQIAGRLGLPAPTVHAVLVRCRINRLSRIDRVTGEPLRRCAATNMTTQVPCSTSTSPSSATFPTAVAGDTSGGSKAIATVRRPLPAPESLAASGVARWWARRSCTP
jgi:transposase-like protein